MSIKRNLSTPEGRAFWEGVEAAAAEVRTWPAWKRAGINVCPTHYHSSITPEQCECRACLAARS